MTYKDFIKKGNNLTSIDTKKRAKPLKNLLFILYKIKNIWYKGYVSKLEVII